MRWNARTKIVSAMMIALITLVIHGCATTETITETPDCEVPARPSLSEIESERMECLDGDTYWDLMEREKRLADWALEMEAILGEVCGD